MHGQYQRESIAVARSHPPNYTANIQGRESFASNNTLSAEAGVDGSVRASVSRNRTPNYTHLHCDLSSCHRVFTPRTGPPQAETD
ncbi:hypothetical protein Bca101_059642 [Brassica carinata]